MTAIIARLNQQPARFDPLMSVTVETYQNFVGGEWVDAVDGGTDEVVNPATGEVIA
jgi:hypothetical protein